MKISLLLSSFFMPCVMKISLLLSSFFMLCVMKCRLYSYDISCLCNDSVVPAKFGICCRAHVHTRMLKSAHKHASSELASDNLLTSFASDMHGTKRKNAQQNIRTFYACEHTYANIHSIHTYIEAHIHMHATYIIAGTQLVWGGQRQPHGSYA
jgi:hypothetical protein